MESKIVWVAPMLASGAVQYIYHPTLLDKSCIYYHSFVASCPKGLRMCPAGATFLMHSGQLSLAQLTVWFVSLTLSFTHTDKLEKPDATPWPWSNSAPPSGTMRWALTRPPSWKSMLWAPKTGPAMLETSPQACQVFVHLASFKLSLKEKALAMVSALMADILDPLATLLGN